MIIPIECRLITIEVPVLTRCYTRRYVTVFLRSSRSNAPSIEKGCGFGLTTIEADHDLSHDLTRRVNKETSIWRRLQTTTIDVAVERTGKHLQVSLK